MAGILLSTELGAIPGIGLKFTARLKKLGIITVKDLLWHFPFRYEDYSRIAPIGELQINQSATVQGTINQIATRRTWKKNLLITEAIIVDETGGIKAVWFNQPYVNNILREGGRYNFAGKITGSKREIYLASPSYEQIGAMGRGETKHTAGLIPIYPETRGLTSKGLRYLIKPILKSLDPLEDFLPEEILKENKLPALNLALKRIHFPLQPNDAESAKKRFAFEDLFLLQLNNLKIKTRLAGKNALPLAINQDKLAKLTGSLPFQLTDSQKQSLKEILADLQKPRPMNRLLQGDVGSGKTVIAALAAIFTAENNLQTAFMAPTEVLAGQHYRTISKIFPNFSDGIALLTAGKTELTPAKISKTLLLKAIADGQVKIIIGTHAVIQKGVKFKNLALAIVDEQHRFGVKQRAALQDQENNELANQPIPHFLSMSATPIPRTLSLTVFGDLDLSTITELPAGRKEIVTKIVAPENRQKAYDFIREQIKKGRQAFVICPRIEPGAIKEGEILSEAKKKALELKSVKEEFEKLSKKVFPDLRVIMLHGKMKGKEKDQIMKNFQERKYDLLVSTSVIEVGVDVPNAAIMIIEGADRFGLAQLYQFRGRVGRSNHQSFCLLFTDSDSGNTRKRLNYLITAKNGFELAEMDLQIRGPGQFLGESQAGLPDVAMDALKDIQLVKTARDAAKEIISNDPEFKNHPLLAKKFEEFQKAIHLE
ncbi:MAG: ATP-dependent DNA helicase RecG [Candidatus Harrisonbacteria bacterium]|nr:ATP-dependent DNA helicase RecG [Candidatus Harrisonbacteria bacterium]